MLARTFSTKYIKNELADSFVSTDIIKNSTCSFYPYNEKQYIGHFDEKFHGIYMKSTPLKSFGSPMTFTNNIMPSCLNQIRYAYTDTMPKIYKVATNVDKYKKNKDVPLSIQKNILGYTTFMIAGGTALFMGKAFINQVITYMGPDVMLQATSTLTIDISKISVGEFAKYQFRARPVIVRHRSQEEINEMKKVPLSELPDPEEDTKRFPIPEWLIVEAVCPHLGCVPEVDAGDFHGFFCPCHGSHFDKSGRIRKGPSPTNLKVPVFEFLDENTILIGG